MIYTIGKRVNISAGHHLQGLSEGHPCARPHGHGYSIEVEVTARYLDDSGMVTDFGLISDVCKRYDHRDLNEMPSFASLNPTAESFAEVLFRELRRILNTDRVSVTRVRVSETDTSWAEVTM